MRALLALLLAALPLVASAGEPRPFVYGSWGALRQAHIGRPTIVHFWGLTCGPCLAELPDWARFAKAEAAVDLVLVAADPVAVSPDDLAAALTKAGLGDVESWRFAEDFTERLEYEVDPGWRGELPYTVLIGRDGAAEPFLGAADFDRLRRWSEQQNRRAGTSPASRRAGTAR